MSNDIVDDTGNEFNDDLLNDLKELDEATDDMKESVTTAKTLNKTIKSVDSVETIDAATLALETAIISQKSAESSHQAIDAAIQLSHDQKQQTRELSDSNIAWRHSVGKANKRIEASKNTFIIMLGVSIAFSLISVAIVGYLYYSFNKSNQQTTGEVLDIISTELSLSNKKQEAKIDQLYSAIEAIQLTTKTVQIEQPPVLNLAHETANKKRIEKHKTTEKPTQIEKTIARFDDSEIKQQLLEFSKQQKQQMAKIETLLAKINQNQASLSKKQTAPKMINPIEVTAMGLTESQLKKLNSISWAVSKQSKMLQAIQNKVNAQNKPKKTYIYKKTPNSTKKLETLLKDLKGQINQIQHQQRTTQNQVQSLKTKKQPLIPREYRYQSRD